MSATVPRHPVWFEALTAEDKECGLLARVLLTYAAWLAVTFYDVPALVFVTALIACPLLFGGVIWHLRETHSRSAVNQIAFSAALAFPVFLILLLALAL